MTRPGDTRRWHKSKASGGDGNACVEVAVTSDGVWVRNSRNRDGQELCFTTTEWAAFLAGVRAGEFDA